jgi:hypothetical protein
MNNKLDQNDSETDGCKIKPMISARQAANNEIPSKENVNQGYNIEYDKFHDFRKKPQAKASNHVKLKSPRAKMVSKEKESQLKEKVGEIEQLWSDLKDQISSPNQNYLSDFDKNYEKFKQTADAKNSNEIDENLIQDPIERLIIYFKRKLENQKMFLEDFQSRRRSNAISTPNHLIESENLPKIEPILVINESEKQESIKNKKSIERKQIILRDLTSSLNTKDHSLIKNYQSQSQLIKVNGITVGDILSKQIVEDNAKLDALAKELELALFKARENTQ